MSDVRDPGIAASSFEHNYRSILWLSLEEWGGKGPQDKSKILGSGL